MSSPDAPACAGIVTTTEPARALAAAIAQVYPSLRTTVEIFVFRAGLGRSADQVADLAAEVLDEAVARALRCADRWRPETNPRPWLATFAAYVVKERQHQARRARERFTSAAGPHDAQADWLDSIADPKTVGRDRLFELLDLVGEPERTLLRRAYLADEPLAEIARSLGINEGALRVRLFRARQRFKAEYLAAERGEKRGGQP